MTTTPYLVAGDRRTGDEPFEVTSPYDGQVVARVGTPSDADVEEATSAAAEVFDEARNLPVHARSEALLHISRRLEERGDQVAETIAREGGKPVKWSKVEAARAASTFRWAAEAVRHMDGELLRLDTGGVDDQGPGPQKALHAGARGERRGHRALRRRPGPRRPAGGLRRLLPGRSVVHRGAADLRPRPRVRGLRDPAGQTGGDPEGRRSHGPGDGGWPADRRAGPGQGVGHGRRGRLAGRRGPGGG